MSTSEINIDEIIAEHGAVYKAGSQGVKDIRKKIMVMSETDRLFSRQQTTDTRLDGANVEIGDVLQAYQDAFTPTGETTFSGRFIDLYELKIDWEKNPTKIAKSWLGFLSGDDIDRAKWPIIAYIINELILKKAAENWEMKGIFHGKPTSIVSGTATMVQGAVKGIRTTINQDIAAGKMSPIALGAAPLDPVAFVDYIESFVDGIDDNVQPYLQDLAMNKTLAKRFRKGMRKKYNMNYDQAEISTVIDTNIPVSGFASHTGSDKIWTTIKGNGVLGVKQSTNEQVFKVESAKRMVSIFTDFWKGVGFWQPEYVFTNDVDLVYGTN